MLKTGDETFMAMRLSLVVNVKHIDKSLDNRAINNNTKNTRKPLKLIFLHPLTF